MSPTEATALLAAARKANPFVEELLVSGRPLPFKGEEVDSYTMGSLEEAVLCMESVGDAWRRSTDALAWLRDNAALQSAAPRARKTPPAKPRRKTAAKP
jgi:hypothetical protein